MMNISTRDAQSTFVFWPAARARAVCFNGSKVGCERCVAEIQGTRGDYGVAEALMKKHNVSQVEEEWTVRGRTYSGSRGPDAVEHVRSEGDGDEEVFRVADAHYVARLVLGEPVRASVYTGFPTISAFPIPMFARRRTLGNKRLCPLHRIVHL